VVDDGQPAPAATTGDALRPSPRTTPTTLADVRSSCGAVRVTDADGPLDVRFTGELDAGMRPVFGEVVEAVAAGERAAELDCRDVTFCGAEGVRMLVRLRDAAGRHGVRLRASSAVRRALALCDDPLPVRAGLRAAPVRTRDLRARVRPA
jgi:anti-anti-sigma factor